MNSNALYLDSGADLGYAEQLAARFSLSLTTQEPEQDRGCILRLGRDGLALHTLGDKAPGPVQVEFASGRNAHRLRQHPHGELVAKAVGVGKGRQLTVIDATAGLGRDSFILAAAGCQVLACERDPRIAALLADGLQRASASLEVADVCQQIALWQGDCRGLTEVLPDWRPAVVYLDPMFPDSGKQAKVKKEMQAFHQLVGYDEQADQLLSWARQWAAGRVVVKRPPKAPYLAEQKPAHSLSGKAVRFDIYPNAALDRTFEPLPWAQRAVQLHATVAARSAPDVR